MQDESPDQPALGDTPRMTTMTSQAGPDLGYNPGLPEPVRDEGSDVHRRSDSKQQQVSQIEPDPPVSQQRTADSVPVEERPPEPAVNPWDLPNPPTISSERGGSETVQRRLRVPSADDEQATTHPNDGLNAFGETDGADERTRRHDEVIAGMVHEIEVEPRSWSQGSTEIRTPGTSERPLHVRNSSSRDDRTPLPSQRTSPSSLLHSPPVLHVSNNRTTANDDSPRPDSAVLPAYRNSQASSFRSSVSSEAARRDSAMSPLDNPGSSTQGVSVGGLVHQRSSYSSIAEDQPVMSAGWSSSRPPYRQVMDQPGLIPIEHAEEQPGLMLVPGGQASGKGHPPMREPNCSITIDSSFQQLRGFCDGAKNIIRGGAGVRKVRQLVCSPTQYPAIGP